MTDTVDALRRAARTRLAEHSDSPDLDACRLLEHVLGVTHSWLVVHARDAVDATTRQRFDCLLARRLTGEPLAYIIGTVGFWTLDLEVSSDVLVPRPDTETLVETVLDAHDSAAHRMLDLGTGSGAIALALASERPAWHITATDASARALACAQNNAARLGLTQIAFAEGQWFEAIDDQRFDIIVSNPPYIAPDDHHLAALTHEPLPALVASDHGRADLQCIVDNARDHLEAGGRLYLEHGADQGPAVRAMLQGWADIKTTHDLAGNERITQATNE